MERIGRRQPSGNLLFLVPTSSHPTSLSLVVRRQRSCASTTLTLGNLNRNVRGSYNENRPSFISVVPVYDGGGNVVCPQQSGTSGGNICTRRIKKDVSSCRGRRKRRFGRKPQDKVQQGSKLIETQQNRENHKDGKE